MRIYVLADRQTDRDSLMTVYNSVHVFLSITPNVVRNGSCTYYIYHVSKYVLTDRQTQYV